MVGVLVGLDQRVGEQPVDRHPRGLPAQPHPPGDLGNRERTLGERHRSQHLPARRGQPLLLGQLVPRGEEETVGAERAEDHVGRGLTLGCPDAASHHGNILS